MVPCLLAKGNDLMGEPFDPGCSPQSSQAIGARWAVEQADEMEDGEQDRLSGEPFSLVRPHHLLRVIVAVTIRVGEQAADMIAPAHVAVLRFLDEAREQRQRERMA